MALWNRVSEHLNHSGRRERDCRLRGGICDTGVDGHVEHGGTVGPILLSGCSINRFGRQHFVVTLLIETGRFLVGHRDAIEPFHRTRPQHAWDNGADGETVASWQRQAIHLGRQSRENQQQHDPA